MFSPVNSPIDFLAEPNSSMNFTPAITVGNDKTLDFNEPVLKKNKDLISSINEIQKKIDTVSRKRNLLVIAAIIAGIATAIALVFATTGFLAMFIGFGTPITFIGAGVFLGSMALACISLCLNERVMKAGKSKFLELKELETTKLKLELTDLKNKIITHPEFRCFQRASDFEKHFENGIKYFSSQHEPALSPNFIEYRRQLEGTLQFLDLEKKLKGKEDRIISTDVTDFEFAFSEWKEHLMINDWKNNNLWKQRFTKISKLAQTLS